MLSPHVALFTLISPKLCSTFPFVDDVSLLWSCERRSPNPCSKAPLTDVSSSPQEDTARKVHTIHSLTHSSTHSLTHPAAHSLFHSFAHLLTLSRTHPLIHSLTHPLTHSITHPLGARAQLSIIRQASFDCAWNWPNWTWQLKTVGERVCLCVYVCNCEWGGECICMIASEVDGVCRCVYDS